MEDGARMRGGIERYGVEDLLEQHHPDRALARRGRLELRRQASLEGRVADPERGGERRRLEGRRMDRVVVIDQNDFDLRYGPAPADDPQVRELVAVRHDAFRRVPKDRTVETARRVARNR